MKWIIALIILILVGTFYTVSTLPQVPPSKYNKHDAVYLKGYEVDGVITNVLQWSSGDEYTVVYLSKYGPQYLVVPEKLITLKVKQ